MTPQLRQAIQLLQFSNLDVTAFVEAELERNPLLARDEGEEGFAERPAPDQITPRDSPDADSLTHSADGTLTPPGDAPLDVTAPPDEAPFSMDAEPLSYGERPWGSGGSGGFDGELPDIAETLTEQPSLRDHLGEQLRLNFTTPQDKLIGAHLIALLEPSGRLGAEPEAIATAMGVPLAALEAVRARMMQFDPPGMFARSLAECLAAQLREQNRLDPAMQAMLDNLDLLARRDWRKLSALCGVEMEDLTDMFAEIRALDPKPGAAWAETPLPAIVPDVLMYPAADGGWRLELNPETMPRVLVREGFAARVAPPGADKETRAFVSERLAEANWLVKSLAQRAQTILKVSAEIVRRQDGFFRHGVSHLRPLILRDIADAVELHESTISRVTANKYIASPRGVFELKYFFTTAIAGSGGDSHSAEAVRHRIRALIAAEAPRNILSDDAIVEILRKEGVDIARRTVAKYREALRIPGSVQRKREKSSQI